MCTQYYLKKIYIESSRNFLDDYSNTESKEIDMTLSGTYLYKYPNFNIDEKKFCTYPSKVEANNLIKLLKDKYKIEDDVIIGTGSNGIIQNIVKILIEPDDNIVTPFYTFNQVEYATTTLKGITRRVKCNDYNIDIKLLEDSIDINTKMVYICNPNNPTGIYYPSKKIIAFANRIKPIIVVDESSIEFTDKKSVLDYGKLPKNMIVIRSFSKAYGLANLRIGYMICSSEFKKKYIKNTTVNEFSGISIICAKEMLLNYNLVQKNIEKINLEKSKLVFELKKMNIDVINSASNTIMTKTTFNEKIVNELLKKNISVVTVYDEFGKLHFRIAVQDKKSNDEFIKRLKRICFRIK